ncbi:Uncharacterised protein [Candidatus Burarchaeum australiense]|nr:Uncharacterised protein [Candidatus Burarchaeum australiense]
MRLLGQLSDAVTEGGKTSITMRIRAEEEGGAGHQVLQRLAAEGRLIIVSEKREADGGLAFEIKANSPEKTGN